MSRNGHPTDGKTDPRIRRTRDRLGDALVELMLEKPFDSITVQDVLDRAGVGRSTFYVHYRDKNDLFMSDVEEFFEMIATLLSRRGEASDRVAPVLELFAHVATARDFHAALVASGRLHDVWDLGIGHFARGIAQRFAQVPRGQAIAAERRSALAHALAGSLFSLLSWWLDHDMPGSPVEMDALFHQLVWAGALAAPGPPGSRPHPNGSSSLPMPGTVIHIDLD